ncbi:hypothetical protein M8C17_19815 [Micromonospora sp. RHAY321]|uniref:hypothetical protein n=1 Tax=Micromonospora sp. RHAY321 TaxID=2944807 RepID=UPI00207D2BDE|nr:hypothetical protein [Micromonospora sp. RHAY321]MCO1597403.1 hypothetical protein [Micromonospora sp. RHAY321]
MSSTNAPNEAEGGTVQQERALAMFGSDGRPPQRRRLMGGDLPLFVMFCLAVIAAAGFVLAAVVIAIK